MKFSVKRTPQISLDSNFEDFDICLFWFSMRKIKKYLYFPQTKIKQADIKISFHNLQQLSSIGKKNISDQNESFNFRIHIYIYSICIKLIYISIYINQDFFYTASLLSR